MEHFLVSAGSAEFERSGDPSQLGSRIFEREMGRQHSEDRDPPLDGPLDSDQQVDEYVANLRSSMEWFVHHLHLLGAQTESYRRLSAHTMTTQTAPQVISECIAAYRLLLGREPDNLGYEEFVSIRAEHGLTSMIAALLGSPEAQRQFAPSPPPPLDLAMLTVSAAAVSILGAAGTDTALGALGELRGTVDRLAGRVEIVLRNVDRLAQLVQMRFDGESSRR